MLDPELDRHLLASINAKGELTMSSDMLGKIVRKLVLLPLETLGVIYDLLVKLRSEQGEEWLLALKRFLRKENPWVAVRPFLEFISLIGVPFQRRFKAKDHFRDSRTGRVRIGPIAQGFIDYYLSGEGKIEPRVNTETLRVWQVLETCGLKELVDRWDGAAYIQTTLSQVWAFLELQGQGQKGLLKLDSFRNLFFCADQAGVIRVVELIWNEDARFWEISAYSLDSDKEWYKGTRVFGR